MIRDVVILENQSEPSIAEATGLSEVADQNGVERAIIIQDRHIVSRTLLLDGNPADIVPLHQGLVGVWADIAYFLEDLRHRAHWQFGFLNHRNRGGDGVCNGDCRCEGESEQQGEKNNITFHGANV